MELKVQFIDENLDDDTLTGNIFHNEVPIGSYEGRRIRDQLHTVIKLNDDFRHQGLGFKAFVRVYQAINEVMVIETIVGAWYKHDEFIDEQEGKSSNLLLYQEAVRDGIAPTEAALQTPTGKWASRLGFSNVEILRDDSENVEVHFTKNIPSK
jgi:hypothetical protein